MQLLNLFNQFHVQRTAAINTTVLTNGRPVSVWRSILDRRRPWRQLDTGEKAVD
jgi:hypothetical protein